MPLSLYELLWAPEPQTTKPVGTQTFETYGLVVLDVTASMTAKPLVESSANGPTSQPRPGVRSYATQTDGCPISSASCLVAPAFSDDTSPSTTPIAVHPPSVTSMSAPTRAVSPYSLCSTTVAKGESSHTPPDTVLSAYCRIPSLSNCLVHAPTPPPSPDTIELDQHFRNGLRTQTGHISLDPSLRLMLDYMNALSSYTIIERFGRDACRHHVQWQIVPGPKPLEDYSTFLSDEHVSWVLNGKETSRARCQALEKVSGHRCERYVHILCPQCRVMLCVTHYHRSSEHRAGRLRDRRH